jgi:hypothetical protein
VQPRERGVDVGLAGVRQEAFVEDQRVVAGDCGEVIVADPVTMVAKLKAVLHIDRERGLSAVGPR